MPHAVITHSRDMDIDAAAMLRDLEKVIVTHDPGAGFVKGRAWPVDTYHHTHVLIEVSMLPKPHRDTAFVDALLVDLETTAKSHLSQPCAFTLKLDFSPPGYITHAYTP